MRRKITSLEIKAARQILTPKKFKEWCAMNNITIVTTRTMDYIKGRRPDLIILADLEDQEDFNKKAIDIITRTQQQAEQKRMAQQVASLNERIKKLRTRNSSGFAKFCVEAGGITDPTRLHAILDEIEREEAKTDGERMYNRLYAIHGRIPTEAEIRAETYDNARILVMLDMRTKDLAKGKGSQSQFQGRGPAQATGRTTYQNTYTAFQQILNQFYRDDLDILTEEQEAHKYDPQPLPSDHMDATRRKYGKVREPHIILKRDGLWYVTPYNATAVAKIKELPQEQRAWNADNRCWVVSANRECLLFLLQLSRNVFGCKTKVAAEDGMTIDDILNDRVVDRSSYYTVLGVSETATEQEIKQAYRKMAIKFHPDKAQDLNGDAFIQVTKAYKTLRDPAKRKRYDLARKLLSRGKS